MVLTKDELTALLAMVSHKLISAREYSGGAGNTASLLLTRRHSCNRPVVDLGALALKLQWLVDNYAEI